MNYWSFFLVFAAHLNENSNILTKWNWRIFLKTIKRNYDGFMGLWKKLQQKKAKILYTGCLKKKRKYFGALWIIIRWTKEIWRFLKKLFLKNILKILFFILFLLWKEKSFIASKKSLINIVQKYILHRTKPKNQLFTINIVITNRN